MPPTCFDMTLLKFIVLRSCFIIPIIRAPDESVNLSFILVALVIRSYSTLNLEAVHRYWRE